MESLKSYPTSKKTRPQFEPRWVEFFNSFNAEIFTELLSFYVKMYLAYSMSHER